MTSVPTARGPHCGVRKAPRRRFLVILIGMLAALAATAGCARRSGLPARPSSTTTAVPTAAPHGPRAPSATFEPGDVFVGLDDGTIEWHGPDGALVATLNTGAKAETGGMAFDAGGSLFVANSGPDGVTRFGADGKRLGPFGSGYDDHPKSIVFDLPGNAYVGQADGGQAVLKFNPDEIELEVIKAPIESRGTAWIDLATDGRTLYYTSQGHAVKRFDLGSGAPLPDFGTALPGDAAFALRIQPDGGVLIADSLAIMRLTASGHVAAFYKAPEKSSWVALALDPAGDSFWAGDRDTGSVCRFDQRSGGVIQSFSVKPGAKVCGLAVRGEPRAALAGAAPVASTAPSTSGGAAEPASSVSTPGSGLPPVSAGSSQASAAPSSGMAATPEASTLMAVPSTTPPALALDTTIVSAAAVGGVVESITGEYGPGLLGRALIDGHLDTAWKATAPAALPTEIVFSFIHRQPALVSAVKITPPAAGSGPKEIEIWTSAQGPRAGYARSAAQTLPQGAGEQTVTFPPVMARFVKLRIVSVYQPGSLELNEVKIVEDRKAGYVPLAERDPEMAVWEHSPRRAAQAGIEWLQVASTAWQKEHNCFGCHAQAQVLMGLAVARRNQYVVSDDCMKDLSTFTQSRQNADGTFHNGQFETATQFAAMSLAYWDETEQARSPSLVRAVDWLTAHQAPSGEIPCDHNEPPIDQGSLMTTANAVFAFEQAYRETGKPGYRAAAEKGLSWIAAAPATTTQDYVCTILALARYGNPAQRKRLAPLVAKLKADQMRDGGWKETRESRGPNAYATGQALYAFKQAGVPIDSPEFAKGVRYLLATQKPTGAWSSFNSQSGRPSDFAPTMWAVIGLAGSFERVRRTEVVQEANGIRVSLDSAILFDFDKSDLKPEAEAVLAQIKSAIIDRHPGAKLIVEGHTDNVGSQAYNLGLSSRRARSVADWLAQRQIRRSRLVARGYGKSRPKYPNTTEQNRAGNRRVEILVVTGK